MQEEKTRRIALMFAVHYYANSIGFGKLARANIFRYYKI